MFPKPTKTLLLFVIGTLNLGIISAQSVQQVQVVEYKERAAKQPMAGVSVAVYNAGAAMSDERGDLTLNFRTLHVGDKVRVRHIEKMGYEVFNKEAIDQWTISTSNTFRIVLCESSRFRALCDQYQQQASDSYAQQYKRDQERLQAQLKSNKIAEEEYKQQLAELEDEYNAQLDNLENYVERFARIDLENLSEEQQRIIQMVQQGKFEEAIAAFESADYLSQFTRANDERQRASDAAAQLTQVAQQKQQEAEQFREAILSQIKTYELVGGRENHQKSYQLRKALVDADTTDLNNVERYLLYLQEHNRIEELEQYAAIFLRQPGCDLYRQQICYKLLAVAHEVARESSKARLYFEKTIDVMRELCKTGSDEPRLIHSYAESIVFLMQNYLKYGEQAKAEAFIPEADSLINQLLTIDSKSVDYIYLSAVFAVLRAQSIAGHQQYTEALAIIDRCIEQLKPHIEEQSILMGACRKALNMGFNIADEGGLKEPAYQYAKGNYELAKKSYEKDPTANCVAMFSSSNNFGLINVDMKKYDEAKQLYADALVYLQEVENHYHQPIYLFRFCLYSSVAKYHEELKQWDDALTNSLLAVEAYQQMDPLLKENADYLESYNQLQDFIQKHKK